MVKNIDKIKEIEKALLAHDFKRKWLSDKSGYWLERKLKNRFIKNLTIIYDPTLVRGLILEAENDVRDTACLHQCKFSLPKAITMITQFHYQ